MSWSAKYLETALFYEPWKANFIEIFCRKYPKLKQKYLKWNEENRDLSVIF